MKDINLLHHANLPGTPASYMPEEDVHAPVSMDDDEANTSSIHMEIWKWFDELLGVNEFLIL